MTIIKKECPACATTFYASAEEIHAFNPDLRVSGDASEEDLQRLGAVAASKGKRCVTCPVCDAAIFLEAVPAEEPKNAAKAGKAKTASFTATNKKV